MQTSPQSQSRPKVALVLSSGGLKPVSAVGLFEFLEEEEIEVDLIVGSSGGSIMGSLWSAGYKSSEIPVITKDYLSLKGFSKIDYRTLLSIPKLPLGRFNLNSGLVKNHVALQFCRDIFKGYQLEDLPIKTTLQTTNIQTGQGVLLSEGPVGDAVYASGNMYPLMPPFNWDGQYLVDGAYASPLPILEAVKADADVIIAMLFNEQLVADPPHFMEGFFNITRAFGLSLIKSQLSLAIDLHHYEIIVINVPLDKPVSITDSDKIPYLVDLGRQAVSEMREEILHAITTYHA